MIIFDLRIEAQQMGWIYLVVPITALLVLASLAPVSVRSRLPLVLPEDVPLIALFFALLLISMVWYEDNERKQAESMVEECLRGNCNVVEGQASAVRPVHSAGSSRFNSSFRTGSFRVGEKLFIHYPSDFHEYSPCNFLSNGDLIRVYTMNEVMVLVEKLE